MSSLRRMLNVFRATRIQRDVERELSFHLAECADQLRAEGLSDADQRTLLADHDLEIAELDPLMSWAPGAPATQVAQVANGGADLFQATERELYEIAEALGARSLNAILASADEPRDQLRVRRLHWLRGSHSWVRLFCG